MKKQPKQSNNTLAEFCNLYHISRSKLSEIAGGSANDASTTTIQRLLHNELDEDYTKRLRLILAANLPQYLLSIGLSAPEIDNQLTLIFDKGEYQIMSIERFKLPTEVSKFFGLQNSQGKPVDPFSLQPSNRSEVFLTPALKEICDEVIEAIKYQEFISVIGPIGSGKTIVRKYIEDIVDSDSRLHLIFAETENMERVTEANIARATLRHFGEQKIPNDSVWRSEKMRNVLGSFYQSGERVGIGFDECHRMNETTILNLKNFLEMSSGGFRKYLGVILFGQPSFKTLISKPQFQEISQRLTVKEMPEFRKSRDVSVDYLQHKLSMIGKDLNQLFDTDAVEFITTNADTPLALGNLANRALIETYKFKNTKVIGAAIRTKIFFAETREPKELSKKAGK